MNLMLKRIAAIAIILFATGSMFYVLAGGSGARSAGAGGNDGSAETALIVYYFDMGKDCSTCLNLESYTYSTLENDFAAELASGKIRWEIVDVDLPENEHFVGEYRLYTKSVVLVSKDDGVEVAYDNLSRIWELVYDKAAYSAYIRTQVREALGSSS